MKKFFFSPSVKLQTSYFLKGHFWVSYHPLTCLLKAFFFPLVGLLKNTRRRFNSGPNKVFGIKCSLSETIVSVHLLSNSSI